MSGVQFGLWYKIFILSFEKRDDCFTFVKELMRQNTIVHGCTVFIA
jgi:hypothetical protein